MKKKLMMCVMGLLMCGLTACGDKTDEAIVSDSATTVVQETTEAVKETEPKQEEVVKGKEDEELENWRGIRGPVYTHNSDYGFALEVSFEFPSLKPTTSGDWAYQMDPALVQAIGWSEFIDAPIVSFEEAFPTYKVDSEEQLLWYRGRIKYTDMELRIDTQEKTMVQDFPAYKYTGANTYKEANGDETFEVPFVAYCADLSGLGVGENMCVWWIVIDDSINNPSMDPLPEGMIEKYAKKMGESIRISQKDIDSCLSKMTSGE